MAVIAVDRILGLHDSASYLETERRLKDIIYVEQKGLIDGIVGLSAQRDVGLAEVADLAGTVLVGAAFILDLGIMVTVSHVGLFFPRGEADKRAVEIDRVLGKAIPSDMSVQNGQLMVASSQNRARRHRTKRAEVRRRKKNERKRKSAQRARARRRRK